MKLFTCLVLALALCQLANAVEVDGELWMNQLSSKEGRNLKIMYLRGIGDVAPLYTATPRIFVPKVEYEEMSYMVDRFYRSPINRVIPVTHVLQVFSAVANGEESEKVTEMVSKYRELFSQRRNKKP